MWLSGAASTASLPAGGGRCKVRNAVKADAFGSADVSQPAVHLVGDATLLCGDGGTGKSLLAMQPAVATATERDWFEQKTRCGSVLYVGAGVDTATRPQPGHPLRGSSV